MKKTPFEINAKQEGKRALVRIVGEIGWDTDSNSFRQLIDDLVADGCTEAHIYINSPGGSCFDAAEIVNILSAFNGNLTGEGGALVASAATYIAAHCKTFSMPENGQFMVHKPKGGAYGTVAEITNYLKLLQDVDNDNFSTLSALVKDKENFTNKWNAGDWWMTAAEAKEAGFITEVRERAKIDRTTEAMIRACAEQRKHPELTNQYNLNMDFLRTTAHTLGLPENATEEQINAAIVEAKKAKDELVALRKEISDKEKAAKSEKIKAALDKAVSDKRIKADARGDWEEMLNANFEKGVKALEAIQPVQKLSAGLTSGKTTVAATGTVTHEGKTFEELRDENPEALAALMDDDSEAYDALYENYLKRNKLKEQ